MSKSPVPNPPESQSPVPAAPPVAGLPPAAGVSFLEHDGVRYELTPLDQVDLVELVSERLKQNQREAIAAAMVPMLDALEGRPELQQSVVDRTYDELKSPPPIGNAEAKRWLDSVEGVTFCFWHMALPKNPELTEANVRYMVVSMGVEHSIRIRDAANNVTPATVPEA